ncbi:hypothetical protein DM77_2478 [Burkholderia mallei]|nr:hypothetical protein DM77_2478 [Burkholderia mallei]
MSDAFVTARQPVTLAIDGTMRDHRRPNPIL